MGIWVNQAKEDQSKSFTPSHCPHKDCQHHTLSYPSAYSFSRYGSYRRKDDKRPIPRFKCHACNRTFSTQSFQCTYYLKRPELLIPVAAGINAGSAHRQLARSLSCAPSTVTRLSARLARQAICLHAWALDSIEGITEPIVFDHFESFVGCQEDALGLATPVGARSWFVYGALPAPHRRAGRRSPAQLEKLAKRKRSFAPAGQVAQSCRETFDCLSQMASPAEQLTLITDDHPTYKSVLSRHPEGERFVHRVYGNPERGPKGSPRTLYAKKRDRAMFAVDLTHGLMRHTLANHKRETLAFGRRTNAIAERAYLFIAWRNFIKWRSERKPDPTTPAMWAGLAKAPWTWQQVYRARLFPGRLPISLGMMKIYRRDWTTPAVGNNVRHRLKNAF